MLHETLDGGQIYRIDQYLGKETVQDVWSALPARGFPNYAAGTWGPAAAGNLLKNDGRLWRRIETTG
jgi:glucose-6-phosphate 1-dehydrogenase